MNPNGSFLESSNEQLEILITIHFQDCRDEANEKSEPGDFSLPSINLRQLMVSVIHPFLCSTAKKFISHSTIAGYCL